MSRLGSFDGLEVALLGEVGSCVIRREVREVGLYCGGVKLLSEEGEQGGPPGLRAIRGAFGRGMGSKERGEAREVSVKPGFKGKPGGERRRLRNGKVF